MTQEGLKKLLNEFMALPSETEWLEFKEAKDNYDFSKLCKYFSAFFAVKYIILSLEL
ncbi:MAG: hypothetical protein AAB331_00830 [Planctomycetota bacterium]|jgi:ATP-dependent DNA helicase RecG